MMTDTARQQLTDTNGPTFVNQIERQALIQRLTAKWSLDLSTRVENLAYERSGGARPEYFKYIQNYYQQIQSAYQNRNDQQQQQQQQQQILQSLNNNGQFVNQQINPTQQTPIPMLPQPQLNQILNQQPRFAPPQQTRMANPQITMTNTIQANALNQVLRLRESQKSNQAPLNAMTHASSAHNPTSMPTIDLSQSYGPQQSINNNSTLSDYLSQPLPPTNRYLNQNPRPRLTTNLNGNFLPSSSSINTNDVLHQFVVGNPPTTSTASSSPSMMTSMANTSSTTDRLLQKILSSNNDGASNTMSLSNRQPSLQQQQQTAPAVMTQPIRSASTTNSNNHTNINSLRSSLISQRTSPLPSVIIMPAQTQPANVQIQPSPNVTIQQSPLNNNNNNGNNGSFAINTQAVSQPASLSSTSMNSSTALLNNYSSPGNRSVPPSGNGSISSPDEETINLMKFFKDNISKIQAFCQKFTNEGNQDKARNAQAIHHQMVQFINNPTYESLPNAKHIRDILERAFNRTQQATPLPVSSVSIPNPTVPQVNDIHQFEKALNDYILRDQKKRMFLNRVFVEPLHDVVNGVPHKKMRLDCDYQSGNRVTQQASLVNQSSLLSQLNDELNLLPANLFSIERIPVSHTVKTSEFNDEYLSRKGLVLRCKLLESLSPLIPPLRLRISTRYPNEQPEVLSLTNTMPPKLEFTDGHPYFEQISTLFISYLFKLPPQHTVTDILNIWRQSVQAAL